MSEKCESCHGKENIEKCGCGKIVCSKCIYKCGTCGKKEGCKFCNPQSKNENPQQPQICLMCYLYELPPDSEGKV